MAARGGVRRLILPAGVGIQAALERDEIREELQRNQMHEGREPFVGFRNNAEFARPKNRGSRTEQ